MRSLKNQLKQTKAPMSDFSCRYTHLKNVKMPLMPFSKYYYLMLMNIINYWIEIETYVFE